MSVFDQAFATVVGTEGGYSDDRNDPGNWTGGKVGAGELRGTKYGISAAAYPDLDIPNLTLYRAKAIYLTDYWARVGASRMPPALVVFDCAVNSGRTRAGQWLQQALGGLNVDGVIGPMTLAAAQKAEARGATNQVIAEVLALRTVFDSALPGWRADALGWSRRICRLAFQALAITGA
jgi:lysozyme family protein